MHFTYIWVFFTLSISSVWASAYKNTWAVLVSASSEYHNYRHQASTCALYNNLVSNGIPTNQILHLSNGDIGHDPQNPFTG